MSGTNTKIIIVFKNSFYCITNIRCIENNSEKQFSMLNKKIYYRLESTATRLGVSIKCCSIDKRSYSITIFDEIVFPM